MQGVPTVGIKDGQKLKRLIYRKLTFIIQIIKNITYFFAGRVHSLSALVRKEEICVLGLVFPDGKSIKLLFKLILDFDLYRKIFIDVYSFENGNNRNSLMTKAGFFRRKL